MTTPLPGKEDIDVTGVPISQDFVKWVLAAKASSGKFCVFTQFSYNLLFQGGKEMDFKHGQYDNEINVRDFIVDNYTPYDGDDSFLEGPTDRTRELWKEVRTLMDEEHAKGGVLDIDNHTISTITAHKPG